MRAAIQLVEKGLVPKPLIRRGIRKLLGDRLREQRGIYEPDREGALAEWVERMRSDAVALVPDKANEQHYEVPPGFFLNVLGKRLKYSSAFYPDASTTLDQAEEAMLALTCERAGLTDGQRVLELGCGWGSLTLWMAEHYPGSRITAVSNSAPQRAFILDRARRKGLTNLEVVTCDMNEFTTEERFDRVVSVEMFEHMRNWEVLLGRVASWMRPDGRLFLHVFAHRSYAYPFEARDESDWMSRYFFTGGMMPTPDLIDRLASPFEVDQRWEVDGTHYARTSEDWLANLEARRATILPLLRTTYGAEQAEVWFQRWRLFFLACAELFGYAGGSEWLVSPPAPAAREGRVRLMSQRTATARPARGFWASIVRWFDSWAEDERDRARDPRHVDWLRLVPFLALHASCLLVLVVGWSWTAVWVALGVYLVRMFAITGFYHRYFSHRSFRTSRPMQFLFALLGTTAVQRGPIWWASHHRAHHRDSDGEGDVHSPNRDGFWWSHVGWILAHENFRPRLELVPDLARFPELRWLDRFDVLVPLLSIPALYGLGVLLASMGLETSGAQVLVWGFCVSTVVSYHVTFSINSIAHRSGTRSYATPDRSRNNALLALLTLGEGWHNNHHRYQASVRQGFRWWQLDPTYYALRLMGALGLVWGLTPVPERILREGRRR